MKRVISIFIIATIICSVFLTGCEKEETGVNPALDLKEEVYLKVAGPWEDFKALEVVSKEFNELYPNCTIEYEYIQDYYNSLEKRLTGSEEPIDIFITSNIQSDSPMLPYAMDIRSIESIDLSNTFEGLIKNFEFRDSDKLYAIPLGAEMRGMYVNTTLLESLDIEVPNTYDKLISACQVLQDNGYVPLQGNPGAFGQQLMYPYICNIIANADDYDKVYQEVNERQAGISKLFESPISELYEFISKDYYNYKSVETELNFFIDSTNEGISRYFLNIIGTEDNFSKVDDKGIVAFMPGAMSLESTIDKMKSDYHSEIEYDFILSPTGKDGGFAYLSPSHGIAINKDTEFVDWAAEFINYLFKPDINELFCDEFHMVPNTKKALEIISEKFDVPEDHISHLGQVTFNYGFYQAVIESLTEVSKANNPKYMNNNGTELYPLEYYMNNLEQRIISAE